MKESEICRALMQVMKDRTWDDGTPCSFAVTALYYTTLYLDVATAVGSRGGDEYRCACSSQQCLYR
jgi:hypothetical protein